MTGTTIHPSVAATIPAANGHTTPSPAADRGGRGEFTFYLGTHKPHWLKGGAS